MRRSIRTRLLVTFTILAVAPLLLVGFILAWQSFTSQEQQALHNQGQEAVQVSTQVTAFIAELENDLTLTIRVRGLKDLNYDQRKSLLSELLSSQNGFDELTLLGANGQELVRVSRTGIVSQADLVDRSKAQEFLSPASTGTIYYSTVHIDTGTGEPFMTVAVPSIDLQSGKTDFVLVAELRFKPIWDLVAAYKSGENDTVYILDEEHRVVAHPDPSTVLKGTLFNLVDQGTIQSGISGDSVILGTNQIRFGDQVFTVVSEQPAADSLALAINAVVVTGIVILLALVFAVGVAFVTIRLIVRPVQSLAATAQAIMDGDLSRQAEVATEDEIGRMAKAFNGMTAQLRKTLEGLQQYVRDLEKAREERERLIRELRETSRVKSEFLSTMSHELRTPLNAMIGFAELMMAGASGALNEKQNRQMSRIHANSLRLLSLIDDVLDLSRIEAGRVEIHPEPFSPREMIAKITAQTSSLAEQKGLRFLVNVDEALPQTILGDQSQIEHVAINLLSNAFKFTEKGEVELTLKPLPDGTRWTMSVRDTGIGIPAHAQEYIFEEFRQVDGSSRRMYGGSGLGLAICRNLCRLMDGEIRVQSTLGEGSTFTVTLPLSVAQAQPVQQPSTSAAAVAAR